MYLFFDESGHFAFRAHGFDAYVQAGLICPQAADTTAMNERQISEHRLDQAARLRENLEQWKEAGGTSERIEQWFWTHINRAALPQRVSNPGVRPGRPARQPDPRRPLQVDRPPPGRRVA